MGYWDTDCNDGIDRGVLGCSHFLPEMCIFSVVFWGSLQAALPISPTFLRMLRLGKLLRAVRVVRLSWGGLVFGGGGEVVIKEGQSGCKNVDFIRHYIILYKYTLL